MARVRPVRISCFAASMAIPNSGTHSASSQNSTNPALEPGTYL
jgi:hypothetical protein